MIIGTVSKLMCTSISGLAQDSHDCTKWKVLSRGLQFTAWVASPPSMGEKDALHTWKLYKHLPVVLLVKEQVLNFQSLAFQNYAGPFSIGPLLD